MTAIETIALTLGSGAVLGDLGRRQHSQLAQHYAAAAGLTHRKATRAVNAVNGRPRRRLRAGRVEGGSKGLLPAVGGAVLGILLFAIPYLALGLGGGDLKLMAAFGSLLGPAGTFAAAILAALVGALLAAAVSVARPRAPIPYAPAIVAGAWLALLVRR